VRASAVFYSQYDRFHTSRNRMVVRALLLETWRVQCLLWRVNARNGRSVFLINLFEVRRSDLV